MKKYLLLLPLFTNLYPLEQYVLDTFKRIEQRNKKFREPQNILFIVSHKESELDAAVDPLDRETALHIVEKIHKQLESALASQKNIAEICTSLDKLDRAIINQCTRIEKTVRAGDPETIQGREKIFFENACPCDFYKNLTDKELHQLIEGTRPARSWFWQ